MVVQHRMFQRHIRKKAESGLKAQQFLFHDESPAINAAESEFIAVQTLDGERFFMQSDAQLP